jgi:transposase-like protein
MSLIAFHQRFVTEATCVAYLAEKRWQGEPVCPKCGWRGAYSGRARHLFKCQRCQKQFTVRTGTIFEGSRLPLRIWFLAIYLVTLHRRGASSIQIAQRLDITQKSAWRLLHSLRSVLQANREVSPQPNQRLAPLTTNLSFDQVLDRIVEAVDAQNTTWMS